MVHVLSEPSHGDTPARYWPPEQAGERGEGEGEGGGSICVRGCGKN